MKNVGKSTKKSGIMANTPTSLVRPRRIPDKNERRNFLLDAKYRVARSSIRKTLSVYPHMKKKDPGRLRSIYMGK